MASASDAEPVEISEQEHILGELSCTNLKNAKNLFKATGVVVWQHLWLPNSGRDIEQQVLNALSGLSMKDNFIYVKARSLLPAEIVKNKFILAFLASQFPTAELLQIYARHATTTGIISLRSPQAIAPLLVQFIIAHTQHVLSIRLDCGGCMIHLENGHGLALIRHSATDIFIHVEGGDYTVVTMDFALSKET